MTAYRIDGWPRPIVIQNTCQAKHPAMIANRSGLFLTDDASHNVPAHPAHMDAIHNQAIASTGGKMARRINTNWINPHAINQRNGSGNMNRWVPVSYNARRRVITGRLPRNARKTRVSLRSPGTGASEFCNVAVVHFFRLPFTIIVFAHG